MSLRNPVMLAAGTAGYLDETADVLDLREVGGVVTKSITARPRPGNKTWRILDARAGMLNAIGLANIGMESFETHVGPRIADAPTTVVGSIAGHRVEDYEDVAKMMAFFEAMPAVEINLSCPNVSGGMEFGEDPALAGEVVRSVCGVVGEKRVFVKLSPAAARLVEVAGAALDAGAHGLTVGNTYPALAIDVRTRKPRLSRGSGGLSGPAIHHISVKKVRDVYEGCARERSAPIIGVGGVMRWEDAAEFILAGASAVQMGTAIFADPRSPARVARGLARWARHQGVDSIGALVGAMEGP